MVLVQAIGAPSVIRNQRRESCGGVKSPTFSGVCFGSASELQGKRFDQVLRTHNHDAFGLAVVLFNLLFMGRHPFAGRFLGRGDMPLETAIAQYRFAYSARRSETQTEPPPHVPLLSDVPKEVSDAFELAFGQLGVSTRRVTAADWVVVLERAEKELVPCSHSSGHHYFRTAATCPWCRMESAYPGFFAFAPPVVSTYTDPVNLGQLLAAIKNVPDPGIAPELASLMPAFRNGPSKAAAASKNDWLRSYLVAVIGVLASVVVFRLNSPPGLFSLAGSVFLALRPPNAAEPLKKMIAQFAVWGPKRQNRSLILRRDRDTRSLRHFCKGTISGQRKSKVSVPVER